MNFLQNTLTDVDIFAIIDTSTCANISLETRMSRVQLALNVSDLDAAIAFYSKFFDTTPAKVRPGLRQLRDRRAAAEARAHRRARRPRHVEPPRSRGRVDRRSWRRPPPDSRRRAGLRDRGRGLVLLRGAGQGVGRRARRRAVGDLHRARRRRDAPGRTPDRRARAPTRMCCATAPESAARCCG